MALGGGRIVLKSEAPFKKNLRLGEIAFIRTTNSKLKVYLQNININPSFASDFLITPLEVKKALKSNFIDTSTLAISGKTRLYKYQTTLTQNQIRSIVRSFVQSHYPDVRIQDISFFQKSIKIPHGHLRVLLKERSKSFLHLYIDAFIYDGEELVKKVPVTVKVIHYRNVLVAARDIPRGKILEPVDVKVKKKRQYNSLEHTLSLSEVIGSVAKRTIYKGQEIKPYALEPNYLVKKRRSVKIVYQKGGIKIELLGLALENGKRGDIIKVKNISSNKVLRCKVLSSGSVLFVQ